MTHPPDSSIVVMVGHILARLIQIFALYVIFHGHYSPGGGFQGGALLAASILLLRLSSGAEESQRQFRSSAGTSLGAVGVLVYATVGLVAIAGGGEYLNYALLPLASDGAESRSTGILLVELGVGLAVMATLVSIFDDLTTGGEE